MCHIKVSHPCGHSGIDKSHQCREYKLRLQKANRQQNSGCFGFFSCFFPSPETIKCEAPPATRTELNICPDCLAAKIRAVQEKKVRWEEKVGRIQGWNDVTNEEIAKASREEKRRWHRCRRCVSENRHPDTAARAANGGRCCVRDPAEVAEQKKTRIPHPPGSARKPVLRVVTGEQRFPVPQHMTSQQKMRAEATRAAQSYGWGHQRKGDWKYVDAGLVKQCINTPGCDPKDIGTGPPTQEPIFEKPAIDWQQWEKAKQGPHGRLPPMPEGPFPVQPLNIRRARAVRYPNRKPVPTRKPTTASRRTQEIVSPLSSPTPSNPPPVSPNCVVEDIMSDLDQRLVDAMNYWQQEPIAAPTPVFGLTMPHRSDQVTTQR
ncbi:hypothetical protein BKA61DRAFT_670236 [Leptodontidium sp. MPI-SDFR-AT-0119]|nr:hypothetical protein BKA61DRAFT_670236 [Leptodontidium sp. MPI-SDFR-AT-0119]